jgi:all-trans-retinol 13,14-reductase
LPKPLRSAHRRWNKKKIERWCGRTTSEVIGEYISDPRLAAVLSAQWGTYGGIPEQSSFGIHALIIRHYLEGAGYPVGGAGSIAAGLVPVIESAGGSARPETTVSEILIDDGRAIGVRTISGRVFEAPAIVSAIGAGETVDRLLPREICGRDCGDEAFDLPLRDVPGIRRRHRQTRRDTLESLVLRELGHERRLMGEHGKPDSDDVRVFSFSQR